MTPLFQSNTIGSGTTKDDFLKCRHWPACKFYTSNPQSLKNHELTHYAQQNLYACADCNIHFTNKSAKDEHIRRKHKTWAKVYSCSHCNYETSVLDEFSEHNVAYHLDSGTSGQIYQCHQCSYSTSWKCFMDSHLLIHSNNELDYRETKKAKLEKEDSSVKSDSKNGSPIQQTVTHEASSEKCSDTFAVQQLGATQQHNNATQLGATQQHNNATQLGATQQHNNATQLGATQQHNNATQLVATQQSGLQQHTVSQQQHSQNTRTQQLSTQSNSLLEAITSSSPNDNMQQVGSLGAVISAINSAPTVSSATLKEYRCNMCHHFTTTCPSTLHQHIKSHNTCQQCGYSSNSITELSLHVCQGNFPYATLNTGEVLGAEFVGGYVQPALQQTTLQDVQQSAMQQVPAMQTTTQQTPIQQASSQQAPATTVQQSTGYPMSNSPILQNLQSKKSVSRKIDEEEFEVGVYRCRKCNYGTSWKCFLDSHMLTHGGEV